MDVDGYDLTPGNRGEPKWSVQLTGRLAGRGAVTADQAICPTTAGIEVHSLDGKPGKPRLLPWSEVTWKTGKNKTASLDPAEIKARGANLLVYKSPEPGYCPHHKDNQILPVQDLERDAEVTCPRCGRKVTVTFRTNICAVAGTTVVLLRGDSKAEKKKEK